MIFYIEVHNDKYFDDNYFIKGGQRFYAVFDTDKKVYFLLDKDDNKTVNCLRQNEIKVVCKIK